MPTLIFGTCDIVEHHTLSNPEHAKTHHGASDKVVRELSKKRQARAERAKEAGVEYDGVVVYRKPMRELGRRVTVSHLREHVTRTKMVQAIVGNWHDVEDLADVMGDWGRCSDSPPEWVFSPDDPVLAQLVADEFGCPVGRPDDWQEG